MVCVARHDWWIAKIVTAVQNQGKLGMHNKAITFGTLSTAVYEAYQESPQNENGGNPSI